MQEVDILIVAPRGVAVGGRMFRPGERALVTRGEALMLRRYGLAKVLRYTAPPLQAPGHDGEVEACVECVP